MSHYLYEPGELKAVAYCGDNAVIEKIIRTAGQPKKINTYVDRDTIVSDGEDMCFITVEIHDESGNIYQMRIKRYILTCPGLANLLLLKTAIRPVLNSFRLPSGNVSVGHVSDTSARL